MGGGGCECSPQTTQLGKRGRASAATGCLSAGPVLRALREPAARNQPVVTEPKGSCCRRSGEGGKLLASLLTLGESRPFGGEGTAFF